jgi:hypothetical protein
MIFLVLVSYSVFVIIFNCNKCQGMTGLIFKQYILTPDPFPYLRSSVISLHLKCLDTSCIGRIFSRVVQITIQ